MHKLYAYNMRLFIVLTFCVLFFFFSRAAEKEAALFDDFEDDSFAEDILYDDDNEEEIEEKPIISSNRPRTREVNVPVSDEETRSYQYEYYAGGVVVLYFLLFFIGRYSNQKIATSWAKSITPPLDSNFASVGFDSSSRLRKESMNRFMIYASGRRGCRYLTALLDLSPRQDLISCLLGMIFPTQETMHIQVFLPQKIQMVLAMCRKKKERDTRNEHNDVAQFGSRIPVDGMDTHLILTDTTGVVPLLFPSQVITFLKTYESSIIQMHFTDQMPADKKDEGEFLLEYTFKVPKLRDMSRFGDILTVVFFHIDVLANIDPNSSIFKKALEKRKYAMLEKEKSERLGREEAAQKRKAEKIRKEKAELMSLSKEMRRKRDEKERKAAMRKRMPKTKIMC